MENLLNIKNLFIEDNISSDTSLLFVQGGFRLSLVNDRSLDLAKLDANSYYYIKFARWFEKKVCKKVNFVAVKQFQHLNPESGFKVRDEEHAKKLNDKNIKILSQVIDYQRQKGKKVILMGHSFGALIVQDYITQFGTGKIKKAIICHSRPSPPTLYWGVMYTKNSRLVYGSQGQVKNIKPKAFSRKAINLMVPFLKKDHTQLWKGKDLSKVQYIVADGDTYVGNISKLEEEFIKSHGGSVIRCGIWRSRILSWLSLDKAAIGDIAHHIVFTPMAFPYMRKIVNKGAVISKFASSKDISKKKTVQKSNYENIARKKLRRKAKKTQEWSELSQKMEPFIEFLRTNKNLKDTCPDKIERHKKAMHRLNKKREERFLSIDKKW